MFPNVDRKSKSSAEDPQKQIAENTSRMVELMLSMTRSNEQLNKKTELLLRVSNDIVKSNTDMCKLSQAINHQSTEAIKYIRRIGKRLIEAQEKITHDKEQPLPPPTSLQHTEPRTGPAAVGFNTNQRSNFTPSRDAATRQGIEGPDGYRHMAGSYVEKHIMNSSHTNMKKEHSHVDDENNMLLSQILKGFEGLKKEIKELKENMGDNIRVDFKTIKEIMSEGDIQVDTPRLKTQIGSWVGEVFRNVTDITYRRYIKGEASEKETRLMFCQAIILNLLDFMDYMRDTNMDYWIKNRFIIADHCSDSARKILKFLKTKFPRNIKNFISTQFQDAVEKINNSEDPRYDILHNIGIEFPAYPPNTEVHYTQQIKTLFNRLMKEVEDQYPEYHRTMTKIFTNGNKAMEGKGKYLIGKKFKDNVPLFTEEELTSYDFKCKSPEILRILIKWLQELEQFVNKPQVSIMNKKAFKDLRIKVKEVLPASAAIRKKIADHLELKVKNLSQVQKENNQILTDLYDNLCELVTEIPTGVEFLNLDDVKAIKFSQLISSCLPFLTVVRIEQIIKILRTFQRDFKNSQLQNLDLVSFSVYDLLRSKCSGSKQQILAIYKAIKNSDYFVVSRVKNRLDTPMNDLLINCKLNKSPLLCEIQLLITNEYITEKDDKNDHFNHFLYELERSRFGPFSEACMIISANDPRMEYAGELKKIRMTMKRLGDEDKKRMHLGEQTKLCHLGHQLDVLNYSLPFVCCICSSFYSEYSSAFNGLKCQVCSIKICPSCIMSQVKNDEERKELYLHKANMSSLKEFFEERIFELRKRDPKGQAKLETLIYNILKEENHQYCQLLRFQQGMITKKGFRRHDRNKTVSPCFFLLKNELPKLGKCEKYDIILLVKQSATGFLIKTMKQLKKFKDIYFMSPENTLDQLQMKATELKKNFVCQVVGDKILVIDYDEVDKDIDNLMQKNRIDSILLECAATRSSTLDLSSLDLQSLDFLEKRSDKLAHVLTIVADENKLTNVDVLYACFPNLGKISLKKNQVSCEEIDINDTNIVDIFFGENNFTKLPVIRSNKLTRIVFKKNKIEDISNLTKCEMNKLIEIGLNENQIPDLPPMNLPALTKLTFKQNKIPSLKNLSNSTIPNIEAISGDDNQISEVPILSYPCLKALQLKNNKLKDIEWLKLSNIPKLQILKLGSNQITQFTTCKFEKLSVLDLSKNKIADISFLKEKQFYKNLKELYLQKNQITKTFNMILPKLIVLNLTQNKISTFNPSGDNKIGKKAPTSDKDLMQTFFESEVPNLQWLGIIKGNAFLGRQIIALEIARVFTNVNYIE